MDIDSTRLIAGLFRLFFQGRYHTCTDARITPRIVQEYSSLTAEESTLLSQCRNTLIANYPDFHLVPTELIDVACLAGMVEKSTHLKNSRLLSWLAQRIRGFNKDLQSKAVDYLNWAIQSQLVYSKLPQTICNLLQLEDTPDVTVSDNPRLCSLLRIASLATTNPIQISTWNDAVARLSATQATNLMDYTFDFLKQNTDNEFVDVFEPLIDCCIDHHLSEIQRRLYDIACYPSYTRMKGGFHFIQADANTRDCLITQLYMTNDLDAVLKALAWIGDDIVTHTLIDLDKQTWWIAQLHCNPSRYSLEAGWYLGSTGERINLCNAESHRLSEITVESEKSEYTFGLSSEIPCPQCSTQMIVVLGPTTIKKYLGLDLESHKRVLWCPKCWESTMIDWEDCSMYELIQSPARSSTGDRPQLHFQIEPLRVNAMPDWKSQLGGYPFWIQREAYPYCSHCSKPMYFLAQIDVEDTMVYAFVCRDCHVCATIAQCS